MTELYPMRPFGAIGPMHISRKIDAVGMNAPVKIKSASLNPVNNYGVVKWGFFASGCFRRFHFVSLSFYH
tara:strand:- start:893 stop:1102 length:210 start_codon:yes stop_codon:yes gene_type:complete